MPLTRRTLLKGLALSAAGLLVPEVALEPARKIWALDGTMAVPETSPQIIHQTIPWDGKIGWMLRADAVQYTIEYDQHSAEFAASAAKVNQLLADAVRGFDALSQFTLPNPNSGTDFRHMMVPYVKGNRY